MCITSWSTAWRTYGGRVSARKRVDEKMAHNNVARSELENVLTRKQETFRKLWEPRLQGQMLDLPHLDAVIREANRWLRQAELIAG
jgi:hypothetical protein